MIDRILWFLLPEWLYRKLPDRCETCGGSRGGVRGNENVIESRGEPVVMCDYCHADEMRYPGWWAVEPPEGVLACGYCEELSYVVRKTGCPACGRAADRESE